MFHLFNEGGVKMERLFSMPDYKDALEWATQQIHGIENTSIVNWMDCKQKPDFYCWHLCSGRHVCPNGIEPTRRKKKQDEEYEGYQE